MANERFTILTELFERAVELPVSEREQFVIDNCAEDPELAAELRSMLAADASGTWMRELIQQAAVDTVTGLEPQISPGAIIGNYRLEKVIGTGGMGDVYEAQQLAPVQRRVAVKLIKAGMHSPEVLSRFESERQTLAMMSHPGIAQVYDAGITDTGQPFFVMELVDGLTINEFCEQQGLDLIQRIELFLKICESVQHAHQKGIIHRDLKPSNVLVTLIDGVPVPKVIDFGVAKAVDQPLTQRTAFTRMGQFIGTPEYMSPEQADLENDDVDTRSDVYSLGVIFYELITGARPFEPEALRAAGFDEIRRIIREVDPPLPSSRLSLIGQTTHSADTLSQARQLQGDLDWITLRAMEKDRDRRYASASELISDIRRYQVNEPVLASPPELQYRIRKFIRRHRVGVGLSATAVSLLLLGAVGTSIGLVRALESEKAAEASALTAEQTISFMTEMFAVADPAQARGETITVKEVLDSGVEQISSGLEGQPEVRLRLLEVMADVYISLGLLTEAQSLLKQAEQTQQSLELAGTYNDQTLADGDSFRIRRQIATLAIDLADPDTAAATLRGLLAEENTLAANHPERIQAYNSLGDAMRRQSRYLEGIEFYEEALRLLQPYGDEQVKLRTGALMGLGSAYEELGDYPAAINKLDESLALLVHALGETHPETLNAKSALARILRNAGQADESERLYREVLSTQTALIGADHLHVGVTLANFGSMLRDIGRYEEASEHFSRAATILATQLGPDHAWVIATRANMAGLYHDLGRYEDAARVYQEVIQQEIALGGADDPEHAYTLNNLGMVYHSMGRLEEAYALLLQANDIRRAAFGEMHPLVASGYTNLGRVRRDQQNSDEALRLYQKSLDINHALLDPDHPDIGIGYKELGIVYLQAGQLPQAAESLEKALAIFQDVYSSGYYYTAEAKSNLGAVRLASGEFAQAEVLLLDARETLLAGEDRLGHVSLDTLERLIELYRINGDAAAEAQHRLEWEMLREERALQRAG